MEIEANWPIYSSLPPELIAAFESAATKGKINNSGSWIYENFKSFTGGRRIQKANTNPWLVSMLENLPEKFLFPLGWDKGHDSGVEGRYDGPADTLEQAIALTTDYARWLRDFGFTTFSHAGTHVHLGHVEYLDEKFGTVKDNPIRQRAEALMWAYFASRESAIFSIASSHRRECGSCTPFFAGKKQAAANYMQNPGDALNYPRYSGSDPGYENYVHPASFDKDTPLWAMHNHLVTNWTCRHDAPPGGFYGGSVVNRRKNLPTLEFRFFSGTHATTALVGYLKLLHAMFKRATTVVIEENLKTVSDTSLSHPILANPFTFTIDDLKKEIDDPWLSKWIDLTIKNKGTPITDEITTTSEQSLPCAA